MNLHRWPLLLRRLSSGPGLISCKCRCYLHYVLLCLCLCMCPCGIKAVDQSVLATTVSNTTTSPPPLSSPSFDPEDVPSCSSDCGPTRAAHLNPLCLCVCGHSASIQNLTVCFKEEQNGMKRMLGTHTHAHTHAHAHTHTQIR